MSKKCSTSPFSASVEYDLGPECETSVIGCWVANQSNQNLGVETTGAITVALVSSAILMIVVLALYLWHRQGKMKAYL